MVKLLTILALVFTFFKLASSPWLTAISYSTVSVMQPQYIWFWAFEGFPIFKITAGLSIIAWCISISQGKVNWKVYKSGQFFAVTIIMIMMHLSDFFTPFKDYSSQTSSDLVIGIMFTIWIMYAITLGLLNDEAALKYFAIVMIFIGAYYTYWANDHYLSGNWSMFRQGRLEGVPRSPYGDGNTLSIVLIISLPFIMFGIQFFKHKMVKALLILLIPLLWHALILFASRGAFLSAICITGFVALIVKSKSLNILLTVGFVAVLAWQGGTMMQRSTSTVSAAAAKNSEEPLNPRLASWQTGIELIKMHPLFGVGPQRFQHATRVYFPDKIAHVAHNAFLNFSANTGLLTGLMYLLLFYYSFKQYKYVARVVEFHSIFGYINRACGGSLIGFFVGAIFLDLIIFEPFYFILVLISANYFLVQKSVDG